MNVTITNMTSVELPIASTNGDGIVDKIDPGTLYAINDDEVEVVTVGDNPSVAEDFQEFAEEVGEALYRLVTFWRAHAPKSGSGKGSPIVKVSIDNRDGARGLRVLQGDDRSQDFEIAPGEVSQAEGPGYIEIRELSGE